MSSAETAVLEFDQSPNRLSRGKDLRDGLSAVVQIGNTLWVANDETVGLERLTRRHGRNPGQLLFGGHKQFALSDYLRLPVPPSSGKSEIEEADIEGLDCKDGYLWLVGSHSLKRAQPEPDDTGRKNLKRLAEVRSDGNRFLLARIPVFERDGTFSLRKEVRQGTVGRTAAQLRGDDTGNDLTRKLSKDKHLRAFLSSGIPGKENGFDIEGIAVSGERVFLGLRGPVLRGFAIILEVEVKADGDHLKLKKIGPNDQPYRKHFLHLGGLGIRDLCVHGPDLLIMAGPTMDLDGPVAIFRWRGGAESDEESILPKGSLKPAVQVPAGNGDDHAEGMALLTTTGGEAGSLLVVYDSPAPRRLIQPGAVVADIIPLPG